MANLLSSFFQQGAVPPLPSGSTSATTSPLWLQDYLYNTLGAASSLAQQPFTPYPGPQVAAPSPQTQQSWQLAGNNVGNYQGPLTSGISTVQGGSSPLTANDVSNFLNPYQQYVTQGLTQNFQQNVLPQIQEEFTGAGQVASPQQQEITARAMQNLNTSIGQSLAGAYQNAVGSALQQKGLQQTGGAALGQMGALTQQLGAGDVAQLAAAGLSQDQIAQANLNAAMNNFYQQQYWPYQQVGFLSDVAQGLPVSAAGTQSQTINSSYPLGAYQASPLTQLATLASGSSALSQLGLRRGGSVRRARRKATGGKAITSSDDIDTMRRQLADPRFRRFDNPLAWAATEPGYSATPLTNPYRRGGLAVLDKAA